MYPLSSPPLSLAPSPPPPSISPALISDGGSGPAPLPRLPPPAPLTHASVLQLPRHHGFFPNDCHPISYSTIAPKCHTPHPVHLPPNIASFLAPFIHAARSSTYTLGSITRRLLAAAPGLRISKASPGLLIIHGYIGIARVRAMVDTGATHSFASSDCVKRTGMVTPDLSSTPSDLALAPSPDMVELGDGSLASLLPVVSPTAISIPGRDVPLKLPSLYELPNLPSCVDIILGLDWLRLHGIVIDPASTAIRFPDGVTLALDLLPRHPRPPRSPPPVYTALPFILSAAAFTNLLRSDQAVDTLLCHITPVNTYPDGVAPQALPPPTPPVPPSIVRLLKSYEDVFADLPPGLPPDRFTYSLRLKDPTAIPPVRGLRPFSASEMEEMRRQVTALLSQGFISPSLSPYGAPVVFARKADGTIRMCVDYRGINSNTAKCAYPLPRIDTIIDQLIGSSMFSKLDLQQGFHQIRLDTASQEKTAFRTPFGLFEYKVMPFGLTNAPSVFQRAMNSILAPLLGRCVVVYIDDILVFSRTPEAHTKDLAAVLALLRKHQFYAKRSKCLFAQSTVPFLGYTVSSSGLGTDPLKCDALAQWALPTSKVALQAFLGLANYYRDFVPNFSAVAAPLYDFTGLAPFPPEGLPPDAIAAFDALRSLLASPPVLAYADPSRPFHISADASSLVGAGAVLWQYSSDGRRRPVAFWSHKWSPAEANYAIHEQELLAVVSAIKQWRHHIDGRHFTVHTDHASLRHIMTQPDLSPRQARWLDTLATYPDIIEYVRGSSPHHVPADALSRHPINSPSLVSVVLGAGPLTGSSPLPSDFLALVKASYDLPRRLALPPPPSSTLTAGDPSQPPPSPTPEKLSKLAGPNESEDYYWHWPTIRTALRGTSALCPPRVSKFFTLADDLLYWIGNRSAAADAILPPAPRLVIGNNLALRTTILEAFHDSAAATAHAGLRGTLAALSSKFWWPTLATDAARFVRSCPICQRVKHATTALPGLASPLQIPSQPFESLSMDFVTGLPKSQEGFNALLVIVDRLTKMSRLIPCSDTVTADDVADLFVRHVFRAGGVPRSIVSDRDPRFTSDFWASFARRLGIQRLLSTASHPQTDGQTERMNQTWEAATRAAIANARLDDSSFDWLALLPHVEFSLNARVSASTGVAPFVALYGFMPRSAADLTLDTPPTITSPSISVTTDSAAHFAARMKFTHRIVADAFAQSQFVSATRSDSSHSAIHFAVGDLVMLHAADSFRSNRLDSSVIEPSLPSKLLDRWLGPFTISEVRGPRTYRLSGIPSHFKWHNVMDVSRLRRYIVSDARLFPTRRSTRDPPAPVVREGHTEYEVERILDHRKVRRKDEFLVLWKGRPLHEASWQPLDDLRNCRKSIHQFDPSFTLPKNFSFVFAFCLSSYRLLTLSPWTEDSVRITRSL